MMVASKKEVSLLLASELESTSYPSSGTLKGGGTESGLLGTGDDVL